MNYQKCQIFALMMELNFLKDGGYKFSYLIIEFLINTYGKDYFIKWLQNPDEFTSYTNQIDAAFNSYIISKIEARIG